MSNPVRSEIHIYAHQQKLVIVPVAKHQQGMWLEISPVSVINPILADWITAIQKADEISRAKQGQATLTRWDGTDVWDNSQQLLTLKYHDETIKLSQKKRTSSDDDEVTTWVTQQSHLFSFNEAPDALFNMMIQWITE